MDGTAKFFRIPHTAKRRLAYYVLSALGICAVRICKQGAVLLGNEEKVLVGCVPYPSPLKMDQTYSLEPDSQLFHY